MAGSCYVSLGLWPGIWVGGERPTVVGAQCTGEPSQAWRRSVRESESLGAGTGRGQALHGGSPRPRASSRAPGSLPQPQGLWGEHSS